MPVLKLLICPVITRCYGPARTGSGCVLANRSRPVGAQRHHLAIVAAIGQQQKLQRHQPRSSQACRSCLAAGIVVPTSAAARATTTTYRRSDSGVSGDAVEA